MKAAEERVSATELEHSALNTAGDNVQASLNTTCVYLSLHLCTTQCGHAAAGHCASQTLE